MAEIKIEWKANHFIPLTDRPKFIDGMKVTYHDNIFLKDGYSEGAYLAEYNDFDWYATKVPIDVHDILIEAGEIPDPLFGDNSLKTAWVIEREWWFRGSFEINEKQLLTFPFKFLLFEGLDLHASLWLNGHKLGESHDMFTPVEFQVKDYLFTYKKNVIAIKISPHIKSHVGSYWGDKISKESTRELKSQSSWGWDWVRNLNSLGIWQPVLFSEYEQSRFKNIQITSDLSKDLKEATVNLEIATEVFIQGPLQIVYKLYSPEGKLVAEGNKSIESKSKITFNLSEIELWWPKCLGTPNLYTLNLLLKSNDKILDENQKKIGFRKVEKTFNPGTNNSNAYPYTFIVNGKALFIKGANWVPLDVFPARLKRKDYQEAIQIGVDHHINMFRMWGGGLQEKNLFFELCDEIGVMVWQEFPMACATYPTDQEWLDQFRRMAKNSVERLHAHPSIVQWCGGNEIFCYGMKPDHPAIIICEEELRKVLVNIPFLKACDDEKSGPTHGPWNITPRWDAEEWIDHQFWNNRPLPFCSEAGCDGMANIEEYKDFLQEKDISINSRGLAHHFSSNYWNYALKHFDITNFEELVIASQWMASDMIRYIVGTFRRKSPESSGAMIWMFNEPWKTCSWAMLGYKNVIRPMLKAFKEVSAPTTISVKDGGILIETELKAEIWVHHEKLNDFSGNAQIKISTAKKTLFNNKVQTGILKYGDNKKLLDIDLNCEGIQELITLEVRLGNEKSVMLYGNSQAWKSKSTFAICKNGF